MRKKARNRCLNSRCIVEKFSIFRLVSTTKSNGEPMLFIAILLLAPLLIGYFLVFLKIEAIYDFTEDFYDWIIIKSRNIRSGRSKFSNISRFTLEPIYSLLISINDMTRNMDNIGAISGIRIGAYLYLFGALIFIFSTLGQFFLVLALLTTGVLCASVVLRYVSIKQKEVKKKKTTADNVEARTRTFVETIWPHFRSRVTKEKVEDLFHLKEIEVDYEGEIFTNDLTIFPVRTRIGRVDKNGGIYDTRSGIPEKIGRIDSRGDVVSERLRGRDNLTH
jgi:hypothetical protein